MSGNLLIEELKELQKTYKEILKKAAENIFERNSIAVIDEINVFWHRNKKLVSCILKNLCAPYQTYVFTGAVILDIGDYEHYPFVTLGKYHLWDDPICKYTEIAGKTKNIDLDKKLKEQIISTINDNIRIIDEASDIIFILPIRFLSKNDDEIIHKAAMQAFLNLFEEKINFKDYQKDFKTIEDIKNKISPNAEKSIVLSEDDDNTLELETRFANYKQKALLPLAATASDAEIFWFCIYSYIKQAFDIIFTSCEYKLIPYVRFNVTFKYVLILAGNFVDNLEIKEMIFKCTVAHLIYRSFDKEKIKSITFRRYYQLIQQHDFENKLFEDLKNEKITLLNPSVSKTVCLIEKNFENILSELKNEHTCIKCL